MCAEPSYLPHPYHSCHAAEVPVESLQVSENVLLSMLGDTLERALMTVQLPECSRSPAECFLLSRVLEKK